MRLINDILLRTGVLRQISAPDANVGPSLANIRWADLICSLILPLLFLIAISFGLKKRYLRKKERDSLTLRTFTREYMEQE